MSARHWYQLHTLNPKDLLIGGTVTITAAGAIGSQDGAKLSGGTVTQTASEDGRYSIAFDRTYKRTKVIGATMVGPTDSAFPTTTGSSPKTRNKATTGFDVQFVREDTQADTDPADGTVFTWWALVSL